MFSQHFHEMQYCFIILCIVLKYRLFNAYYFYTFQHFILLPESNKNPICQALKPGTLQWGESYLPELLRKICSGVDEKSSATMGGKLMMLLPVLLISC